MKLTQYTRQEAAIAASETNGIRQRWLWGLRLIRDGQLQSAGGGGLRHGVTEQLIQAAVQRDLKLSQREVQYRLQCARSYPTESQIRNAIADFPTWFALTQAGFPPYPKPDGEHPADHRTAPEITSDRARALADALGAQDALFPLSRFEPVETTLKDLRDFVDDQAKMTANFVATERRRRAELDLLVAAADGDMSMTWAEAHQRAHGESQ